MRKDVVKHPELKEADMLGKELDQLVSRTKLEIYKMNVLPTDWKDLYNRTLSL